MIENPQDLQQIREEIEAVDRKILAALKERMGLMESVAMSKLGQAFPFRDKQREEQLLLRIREIAVELGLDAHEVERIYRLIMQMAIAHQQAHVRNLETAPLRVAYQGVEGSYSHLTAQRRYRDQPGFVLLTGYETFREAAEAVTSGAADVALLPVENSTAGSINETYDLLAEGGLTITAEAIFQVQHCLLALPGANLEDLRVVMSHPQALRQCDSFLRSVPWIKPQTAFDTAGAARKVSQGGDLTVAAIASESAARAFGLEILGRSIQTQVNNYTRFVEVAIDPAPCPADAPCKTSLLLVTAHTPGALGEVIVTFARHGVNLTKLESRPIPDHPWEYQFYLDIEGHAASEAITGAIEEIAQHVRELRILGTYPRAIQEGTSEDSKE